MSLALVQDAAAYNGFRILEEGDLPHAVNLQQACISDLGEGQTLIHEKSEDDFGVILTSPHTQMLGIWNQGALIAQAVALFPDLQNPDPEMMDILDRELAGTDPQMVTTLGGVIVHPSFKGRGLMNDLVSAWKTDAVSRGREHALAMITDTNIPSLAGFLHGGLDMIGVRPDPEDGSTVYLAHGSVTSGCRNSFVDAAAPEGAKIMVSTWDIENRETFFEAGYRGTGLVKSHCLKKTPEGYDGPLVKEDQSALCMEK